MYQQITLIGNLGSDPEMRYTPSGVAVASFSLAVNRSWVGQDGQRQDKTTWFRVSAWNKLAETVTQYLSKGRQVMVVGEVEEARGYLDRDGNPRASLEVRAQTVRFLGQRGDNMMGSDAGGQYGGAMSANNNNGAEVQDEDIPF
ncbi:MAG: single-stranded DNA-binding protein [Caldilineaceae bacterium]